MRLEMFCQLLNTLCQYGNLHFRRASILFMDSHFLDELLFLGLRNHPLSIARSSLICNTPAFRVCKRFRGLLYWGSNRVKREVRREADFFHKYKIMFDLKVINSVLGELEEVRGIPRASIIEAIEAALATAYKKEYGKKGQIIRTTFDPNTGETHFFQVKIVVDDSRVIFDETEPKEGPASAEATAGKDERSVYNSEHHILLEDARKIKKDAQLDEEIIFPIESKGDYGRIAAQTAKQVIMQKIREAEKTSVVAEFGKREGEIVNGTVQRIERGNIFVDMGRATGILPYEEQIPGERFSQGERVRAYLYRVEESPRGVFL